ncbi:anaerobic dimethyl sulfoxide reductase subunit C [Salmonella enterica subsp. enterica serovar Typhimurium str. DT104]|nr:anaerobic dimethyl sulfoxide reductase subunit C [Salmonella enterica subsp. enterica serovar Typhimurium str. DT104]
MGSGWHEWPLMIFTVFGQCVAGGFIVLALALMKGDLRAETQQRVIACMFGLWVLMGIGFIASMLHLGSPMRAFNSLNRVGAFALSNEIASGSVFFAVGGIGWLLAVLKKLPPALRTLWLIITMVPGVTAIGQGAWLNADMFGDKVDRGGSINILTSHRPSPLAKGNPSHSNLVQVEKA